MYFQSKYKRWNWFQFRQYQDKTVDRMGTRLDCILPLMNYNGVFKQHLLILSVLFGPLFYDKLFYWTIKVDLFTIHCEVMSFSNIHYPNEMIRTLFLVIAILHQCQFNKKTLEKVHVFHRQYVILNCIPTVNNYKVF